MSEYGEEKNKTTAQSLRREGLAVPVILAERILDLFEESGTTPKEQDAALDIVRRDVLDRLYAPTCEAERSPQ